MEITEKKRGIAEQLGDTKILINCLEKLLMKDKKEIATYEELSAAISRDVQVKYRHLLQSARKAFEEANKVTTDTVMNTGVKLTNDYTGILNGTLRRVGKMTKKASRRVVRAMEYDGNIPNDKLIEVNSRLSLLAPIAMMTKPSAVKRIQARVSLTTKELPTAETLKLFEK
jgi:hypothetical protein